MILVVTSVVGGAGRSTLSRGLAAALARAGATVAWVGADLGGGPDGEGVDLALRAAAAGEALSRADRPVYRIGIADAADLAWARANAADLRVWPVMLERIARDREVVVVDAPRLFEAGALIERATGVLLLAPLDRPAPRSFEPVLAELARARRTNPSLRLDGIALTRLALTNASAARDLEANLALAPSRAFLAAPIPEGAGPAREGAIESLALAWARRVELTPAPRAEPPRERVRAANEVRA